MAKIDTNQRLEDFMQVNKDEHKEIKEMLSQIFKQTKETNGRVTKLETRSETYINKEFAEEFSNKKIEEARADCPAVKYIEEHKVPAKDWKIFMASGISSVITGVLIVVLLKIFGL